MAKKNYENFNKYSVVVVGHDGATIVYEAITNTRMNAIENALAKSYGRREIFYDSFNNYHKDEQKFNARLCVPEKHVGFNFYVNCKPGWVFAWKTDDNVSDRETTKKVG